MQKERFTKVVELSESEMQTSGGFVHHLLVAVYACAAGAAVWHSVEGSYMAGYEAATNR
ncbi:hypothetical protein [Parabacteroides gordonii]|jgi:hypothetical protein|uniref:hypothetical protein n=1 Tax=Parabacteroides gordonii TaxID=574930 RepID=UPI00241F35EA|nr:hypothetical protein [Parabacteroides gordonii]